MDKKKLALIHIIKKELGLADNEYRRILHESAGVNSSKDLTEEGFRKLMNYFVRSGYYRVNREAVTLRQKMLIKHIADDLGWKEDHLENFVKKYYHKTHLDHLSKQEAMKVISSLKHIQANPTYNQETID